MVYLFLADGFEETEAVATLDMLRRGGIDCRSCGVGTDSVKGAHGITVMPEVTVDSLDDDNVEAVVLPGGMPGTLNLEKCKRLQQIIDKTYSKGNLIAAICAAPTILLHKGLLKGKKVTVYPSFKNEMLDGGVCYEESTVSRDGNIITASGPNAAIDFGLAIVAYLKGNDCAMQVKNAL